DRRQSSPVARDRKSAGGRPTGRATVTPGAIASSGKSGVARGVDSVVPDGLGKKREKNSRAEKNAGRAALSAQMPPENF
ncbi:hypothetical protein, partial [Brasilonema bromeliae]|uniref:hypothetical protein n=1 Tax=Brasilonema bromeliae TaxID=383615 RepID=UPI001B7D0BAB